MNQHGATAVENKVFRLIGSRPELPHREPHRSTLISHERLGCLSFRGEEVPVRVPFGMPSDLRPLILSEFSKGSL